MEGGGLGAVTTAELKAEIEAQTSVFPATAGRQPYIQHRGGPAQVRSTHTIGIRRLRRQPASARATSGQPEDI
jgi:hypothetical protein